MGLDVAKGKVSLSPVVLSTDAIFLAYSDSDNMYQIHHDINKKLSGILEYTKADESDKWAYRTNQITTSGNLLGGAFTDLTALIDAADKVKWIYINHTGENTSGSTSVKIYITLDGGDGASESDAIELDANESIILKFKDMTVENLHVATADGSEVSVLSVAILDDVA